MESSDAGKAIETWPFVPQRDDLWTSALVRLRGLSHPYANSGHPKPKAHSSASNPTNRFISVNSF